MTVPICGVTKTGSISTACVIMAALSVVAPAWVCVTLISLLLVHLQWWIWCSLRSPLHLVTGFWRHSLSQELFRIQSVTCISSASPSVVTLGLAEACSGVQQVWAACFLPWREREMKARKTLHYNKDKSLNSHCLTLDHHRKGKHKRVRPGE